MIYPSVFLISVGMLGYEVVLTRLLAIMQWSHFAYLVVSIALMGLAAAGTTVALSRRLRAAAPGDVIAWCSFFAAVLIVAGYHLAQTVPFDEVTLAWDRWQWANLGLYYLWFGLPFFATGIALAQIFTADPQNSGRIYFFNLTGSALGCLFVLPLLNHYSPEVALKWIVLIYLLGSLAMSFGIKRRFVLQGIVVLSSLAVLLSADQLFPKAPMSPYKPLPYALSLPNSRHMLSVPHVKGQLDVVSSAAARYASGLAIDTEFDIPSQLGLTTDGGLLNAITFFDGDLQGLRFIEDLPSSWFYNVGDDVESVLIIEPGGGLDVLGGIYYGVDSIETVQSHPKLKWLVDEALGDFSGRLYSREGVRSHTREVRAFLGETDRTWDAIILSTSMAPGANSTGMYGINENYLFTVDAFDTYLDHLSDGGWLTITRHLLPPPRESVRIVSLARTALEGRDIKNPKDHILVFRSWGTITVAIKKDPIAANEIASLKKFLKGNNIDVVYYPGMREDEANRYNIFSKPFYHRIITELLTTGDASRFLDESLFDFRPVGDDRPFFFFFFPLKNLKSIYATVQGKWQALLEGGYIVHAVLFQAIIITSFFVILPLFLSSGRTKIRKRRTKAILYFTLIGFAYMLAEIVFIQLAIRFLGSPTYAVATVVAALLFSSGLGSLFVRKLEHRSRFAFLIALLALLLIASSQVVFPIMNYFERYEHLTAIILTLIIFPMGFIMGLPFPSGVRWLGREDAASIPWGYAFNGAASVTGAVLAIVLAVEVGFCGVLIAAALLYSIATLLIFRGLRVST